MEGFETFVLDLLRAVGANPQATQGCKAYRTPVPQELKALFRNRPYLYFTFDEEYYDLHLESGVEFVAPGYPLLDRLVQYAQARLLVSEANVSGQPLRQLGLTSKSLRFASTPRIQSKPLICFHLKLVFRSDEYSEEIIRIWIDVRERVILARPLEQDLQPASSHISLAEDDVKAAWNLVKNDLDRLVQKRVAEYEAAANTRLTLELRRLARANAPSEEQKRVLDRYRLRVQPELIFAEVLHYPIQIWQVTAEGKDWQSRYQYRWDTVRRSWVTPPSCPVCHREAFQLEACDEGKHVACQTCTGSCSTCQRGHCASHPTQPCRVCGKGNCRTCLSACHGCTHPTCHQCLGPCPTCQELTCLDCFTHCAVCDNNACPDHFAACHLSGALLCQEHATACGECHKVAHPDKLHVVHDLPGKYCEACLTCCGEQHSEPAWLLRRSVVYCAAPHLDSFPLCPDHRGTCALHSNDHYFCRVHLTTCHTCHRQVCGEHQHQSRLSGQIYCSEHARRCERCSHWAGAAELTLTEYGEHLCKNCILPCATCGSTHLWNIDRLHTCPFCLQRNLVAGKAQSQRSLELLKKANLEIVHCGNHLTVCHVCGRRGCQQHIDLCPECSSSTCINDFVITVSKQRLCHKCVRTCGCCPPENYYIPAEVVECCTCHRDTCAKHRRQCESCLKQACREHFLLCKVCHGYVCSGCEYNGACPACRAFRSYHGEALLDLPLSCPPQYWAVLIASCTRSDSSKRVHVLYYPEVTSFFDSARFILKAPPPQLDVIELRDKAATLVRSRVLAPADAPIPPFSLMAYAKYRWLTARRQRP